MIIYGFLSKTCRVPHGPHIMPRSRSHRSHLAVLIAQPFHKLTTSFCHLSRSICQFLVPQNISKCVPWIQDNTFGSVTCGSKLWFTRIVHQDSSWDVHLTRLDFPVGSRHCDSALRAGKDAPATMLQDPVMCHVPVICLLPVIWSQRLLALKHVETKIIRPLVTLW